MYSFIQKIRAQFATQTATTSGINRPIAATGERQLRFNLPAPEIIAGLRSDIGCRRQVNEDSCRFVKPNEAETLARKGLLLLVADGMGGHVGGQIASRSAVEVISRVYYEGGDDIAAALRAAFLQANRAIHQQAEQDKNLTGMGTTCTALVLHNGFAYCAHIGDSRLYLVRDGQIYLMSEDHSAVMEMVRRGLLTLEKARHHEDKNVILRALGTQPKVEISVWDKPFPVQAGDQFVLCSDGLYDLVEDEEIKHAVLQTAPEVACEHLIALALQRGGHDNITVGVLRVEAKDNNAIRTAPPTRELVQYGER